MSFPATRIANAVMDSPALVPAKDAVESLIRRFVSPLLPRLKISRSPPTVAEQQKVGKQVHAVVILYNYYQRKESPKSEYLDFRSFCETACISYSSLMNYMKFMCKGAGSLEDVHAQLSITEKFVMDACDICTALNVSLDSCNLYDWAISKVAVFLVDAAKEKCLLKNGNVILGSWSLVEKDLEKPLEKSACNLEMNYAFRNRAANESDKCYGIEDFLQEIAYSAVEQDMGITCSNLNILEYHLSYSLSQLKSSTRLYIMSYKLPGSSAVEISIEDVISLRGPPVKRSSCGMIPEITSVAEHYCILPYIDIISEWASRKTSQGDSPLLLKKKAVAKYSGSPLITANYQISVKSESTNDYGFSHSLCQKVDMVHGRDISGKKKMKLEYEINEPSKDSFQYRIGNSSVLDHKQNPFHGGSGSKCQNIISINLKRKCESTHSKGDLCLDLDASKDQVEYSVKKQCLAGCDGNTFKTMQTSFTTQGKAEASSLQLVTAHHKFNDHASRFLALASKKDDFEELVFEFLKNCRDELCCQHRLLEDFIAHCEMNIQTIISGENQISHPEVIMKACDFLLSSKVNRGSNLFGEVQLQPHNIRRRLFDADLQLRSPCQQLDEIFRRNHWILPKYCVFPSPDNGKYRSIIKVKGLDFECALRGDPKDGPEQARESAAATMLTKLQEMAAQAHRC